MADQRHSNPPKNKHTQDIVAAAADAVEENRRQTVLGLTGTSALGQMQDTISRIFLRSLA
jgi:hypothetical protein